MPTTSHPRSSSTSTSAAPSPRDTPVTNATRCILTPSAPLLPAVERRDDDDDHDHGQHQERDLPGALGVLAGDDAVHAILHALEATRTVGVRQQPRGGEDVLEGLLRPGRGNLQVAV